MSPPPPSLFHVTHTYFPYRFFSASNNSGPQVQVYTTLPPGFQAQYQQPPQQTYQQPYQAQSYQQPQQYQQQPYAPQQQQPYVPQQQPHTTAPPSNWQ